MGHVPAVYLPGPWPADAIGVPDHVRHHLGTVLRLRSGAPVAYTDGAGTVGRGRWVGGTVRRGEERRLDPPRPVTVAVAPPRSAHRARFLVEKLAELGTTHLVWLETSHGRGRPPRPEKARAWAVGALEQSRGAFLMEISGPAGWEDLERPLFVADPTGGPPEVVVDGGRPVTLAVGPEGGLAPTEVPGDAVPFRLGERILRVETAAVVAVALVRCRDGAGSLTPGAGK